MGLGGNTSLFSYRNIRVTTPLSEVQTFCTSDNLVFVLIIKDCHQNHVISSFHIPDTEYTLLNSVTTLHVI